MPTAGEKRASTGSEELKNAVISELTLRIAERALQLALRRRIEPGRELDLWLEAEAQVKRERSSG
jgi:hypothetical protein